jgi:PAS domain S-box-containing protein
VKAGDTVTPESYNCQRKKMEEAILEGKQEPEMITLDILHKDGRVIPVEIHARFIFNDQGFPVEILGIARDITWRREAEQALKESEKRYRSLVNTMREGLVEVDSDWNIRFVNERFTEMTGFSKEKLVNSNLIDLVSAEFMETAKNELARRRAGKFGMYELELMRADGETLFTLISPVARYDPKGNYLGSTGVISDITDLKLSTEKLRRSEKRFKFLAENMGDVVWTMDLDLNTTYVSPSIEKLFGYTPEERILQKLEEMITPDSLERIQTMLFEELERDKLPGTDPDRTATIEVEYYHRDGFTLWMENQVKAIRDEVGAVVGIYGVSRNITDRKAAEKALIAEKEKLQDAITQIKQLSGMLPICASCKKIRDDQGYWNQIESYIRDHSEADFSHSICPSCAKKLYPDLDLPG